ncbi:hypothetical protein [Agrobacterium rosae]|uniref:hypothetical protein n=1 Tax=Agrobacterium rosae TaxID=1972867 RepID=UPI000CD82BB5|nr:hypothetical protein [Agrobacterium rosae]POO56168.1 hypothetical protein CTT39_05325 [Agrobacterium rosae]
MDADRLRAALANLRPEDKLAATVAHWNETPKGRDDKNASACSYAVAILINRRVRWIMWGNGYAPEAIPPVVFAIDSLLKVVPEGRYVEVSALRDLYRYIALGGIGRYAMQHSGMTKSGSHLGCYPAIGNIITASDQHRWSLSLQPPLKEARGYAEAIAVARGTAKSAALKHKLDHTPTVEAYPKPVIVEEHVNDFPA